MKVVRVINVHMYVCLVYVGSEYGVGDFLGSRIWSQKGGPLLVVQGKKERDSGKISMHLIETRERRSLVGPDENVNGDRLAWTLSL
jgi:hypothetical protein